MNLTRQKRYTEAAEIRQKCLAIARRVYGDKHSLTHMLAVNIADLSQKLTCDPNVVLRDPNLAMKLAMQAVATEPESNLAIQYVGWAHYRLGRWQEAIEALQKSVVLDGKGGDPWQWLGLAMAHWQLNQPEVANDYYGRSAAWLPSSDHVQARQLMTEAETLMNLSAADRENAAIKYLSKRIEKNPQDLDARLLGATFWRVQKQWSKQAADLEVVVQQRPDDFKSLVALSLAYVHLKKGQDCMPHALEMVRLQPDRSIAHWRLGDACHLVKDFETAIGHFERASEIKDVAQVHLARGRSLARLSRWDEALTAVRRHNSMPKTNANGLGWDALLLLRLNKPEEYQKFRRLCVKQMLESSKTAWSIPECIHCSTFGPLSVEEIDQLLNLGIEALKKKPDDANLLRDIGALHFRKGEFTEAMTFLDKAFKIDKGDVYTLLWRAMVQQKSGNNREANAMLKNALELQKSDSESWSDRKAALEIPMLIEEAKALIESPPDRVGDSGNRMAGSSARV